MMTSLVNLVDAQLTNRCARALLVICLLGWGGGAVVGAGACLWLWGVRTYRVIVWPETTGLVRESAVVPVTNSRGAKLWWGMIPLVMLPLGVVVLKLGFLLMLKFKRSRLIAR